MMVHLVAKVPILWCWGVAQHHLMADTVESLLLAVALRLAIILRGGLARVL